MKIPILEELISKLGVNISLLVVEFPELEEEFSFMGIWLSFLLNQKEAIPTEGSSWTPLKIIKRWINKAERCFCPRAWLFYFLFLILSLSKGLVLSFFVFFLLLDQKEAKLKAERCFCPRAFTLARRSAGPWLFYLGKCLGVSGFRIGNGRIDYTKKPFPVWRKGFAELDIPY